MNRVTGPLSSLKSVEFRQGLHLNRESKENPLADINLYLNASRQNYFARDPALTDIINQHTTSNWQDWTIKHCYAVGEIAATRWATLAVTANENSPIVRTFNRVGERVDHVEVHPSYDQLAREVYESGVVWPRFDEKTLGSKSSWIVPMAIGYLAAQAEQGLFCPVCLTAGTAWLLERFGDEKQRRQYLTHVGSKSYDELFEGAMFLTERAGGSDVGANAVKAELVDGQWYLRGDKWFASNAGRAKVMMVLARPDGASEGTRGLGLFVVPLYTACGKRNAIRIHRMKDKLGTRSMPSGEITFEGALAYPLGPIQNGFAEMVEMLSLSRIYNAIASVANMRRVCHEVISWSQARSTFGTAVDQYPMVRQQIVDWIVEQESCMRAAFECVNLLDQVDANRASQRQQQLLRLLTPILKYHTARAAVDCASWGCESFGGQGYIEEWPLARLLRDAQVLPIWEGFFNTAL